MAHFQTRRRQKWPEVAVGILGIHSSTIRVQHWPVALIDRALLQQQSKVEDLHRNIASINKGGSSNMDNLAGESEMLFNVNYLRLLLWELVRNEH